MEKKYYWVEDYKVSEFGDCNPMEFPLEVDSFEDLEKTYHKASLLRHPNYIEFELDIEGNAYIQSRGNPNLYSNDNISYICEDGNIKEVGRYSIYIYEHSYQEEDTDYLPPITVVISEAYNEIVACKIFKMQKVLESENDLPF